MKIVPVQPWVIPLVCLLVVGSLLGLSTSLAALAYREGISATALLAWSLSGAGVVLGLSAVRRHQGVGRGAKSIRYLVIAAAVSLVIPNLVLFAAVPQVGAAFVAVAIASPPLWTYLGALGLRLERLQFLRAAGVSVALAGSVLLAVLQLNEPDVDAGWVVATLAAPVLLAVGNVYRSIDWPDGATPAGLAAGMVITSALGLAVIGALVPGLSLAVPANGPSISIVIAQAAVFTGLYRLFFVLQDRGGPVYLSLVGSVAAVVGAGVAVWLLGEAAPPGLLPGGALVLAGVALLTAGAARSPTTEAPARPPAASRSTGQPADNPSPERSQA